MYFLAHLLVTLEIASGLYCAALLFKSLKPHTRQLVRACKTYSAEARELTGTRLNEALAAHARGRALQEFYSL